MKNILYLLLSLASLSLSQAQTAIGKRTVSTNSVLLEFANEKKGLVLPYVSGAKVENLDNGTFLFDMTDKRIKFVENGKWINYSGEHVPGVIPSQLDNTSFIDQGRQSILGSRNTTAKGALVLESTNKVMVLPKVEDPHLTIIDPAPGMIAYDPVKDLLAVYDGANWYFWTY